MQCALFWLVGSSVAVGVSVVDALALVLGCLKAQTSDEPVGCFLVHFAKSMAVGFLMDSPSWLGLELRCYALA
jgi:hypothetical protein